MIWAAMNVFSASCTQERYAPLPALSVTECVLDNNRHLDGRQDISFKVVSTNQGLQDSSIQSRCDCGARCNPPVVPQHSCSSLPDTTGGGGGAQEGLLYKFKNGSYLTRDCLVTKVRQLLEACGIESSKLSGHSFRIGAVTTVA